MAATFVFHIVDCRPLFQTAQAPARRRGESVPIKPREAEPSRANDAVEPAPPPRQKPIKTLPTSTELVLEPPVPPVINVPTRKPIVKSE